MFLVEQNYAMLNKELILKKVLFSTHVKEKKK